VLTENCDAPPVPDFRLKEPEDIKSPPNTLLCVPLVEPETKKTASDGRDGKEEPGLLANITLPVIPILEELLADPEILFAINAMFFLPYFLQFK
jgi:hypothetical protein